MRTRISRKKQEQIATIKAEQAKQNELVARFNSFAEQSEQVASYVGLVERLNSYGYFGGVRARDNFAVDQAVSVAEYNASVEPSERAIDIDDFVEKTCELTEDELADGEQWIVEEWNKESPPSEQVSTLKEMLEMARRINNNKVVAFSKSA